MLRPHGARMMQHDGGRDTARGADTPLPAWLWLWTAPGLVLVQIAALLVGPAFYEKWTQGELGLIENATALFLLIALLAALHLHRLRARVTSRWFGPFAALMVLGCFYFLGEELSWGQHLLGFEPPRAIAARNDQGEFNLHNDPVFEKFLDQLPRGLLTFAALIGGVIAPLVRRKRTGRGAPDFGTRAIWGWIWPTLVCVPSAFLAVTVSIPKKIYGGDDGELRPLIFDFSAGETKEACIALFLMVYLLSMRKYLLAGPLAGTDTAADRPGDASTRA